MKRCRHTLGVAVLLAVVTSSAAGQTGDGAAEAWAEIIMTEVTQGRPMPALSTYDSGLDMNAAYAVQRMLVEALPQGRPIGGYKAGFTSRESQRKVGLREPVSGVLPAAGRLADGAVIDATTFKGLMVEVEIGFVLRSPIRRSMKSVADLKTYIAHAVPAIELPDLNYANPQALNGRDLVATNISARAYIVGKPFVLGDLAEVNAIEVKLHRDDTLIDEGRGSRAMGDQLEALLWLINNLVRYQWPLLPGHVLITGTLGQINPGLPGSYRADYGGRAALAFKVTGPEPAR